MVAMGSCPFCRWNLFACAGAAAVTQDRLFFGPTQGKDCAAYQCSEDQLTVTSDSRQRN